MGYLSCFDSPKSTAAALAGQSVPLEPMPDTASKRLILNQLNKVDLWYLACTVHPERDSNL
jgi:hypothetical protein